jgi:transcriptional regulator with XRE-family HTH domain
MWEIVPENLIAAMQRAGMNQSQLANAVGVKQPSIGRLISGETKTTRALDLIASALGTTPAYLKGETSDPQGALQRKCRCRVS